MTHRLGQKCVDRLLEKQTGGVPEWADEAAAALFKKRAEAIILKGAESKTSPEIVDDIAKVRLEMFGEVRDYSGEKRFYNDLMLGMEAELEEEIKSSEDPFKTAIQYAMSGNLIDFGALPDVSEKAVRELLKRSASGSVDGSILDNFRRELSAAAHIVYITDNCGEIVLDKLLIKEIKKIAPEAEMSALVRGRPVLNDATGEDAAYVGLDRIVRVVGNGSAIAGTALGALSHEAAELLKSADVIIAKGQGNYETLQYSDLNIFFIFLCKCRLFTDRFNVPLFTGVLTKQKN